MSPLSCFPTRLTLVPRPTKAANIVRFMLDELADPDRLANLLRAN
jgi:hypothetical protein